MNKMKVITVVGTRPEIIRLSRVIHTLDSSPVIEHILVHTGQNYDYELNEIFFKDLGIRKPDYYLNAAAGNATVTIGNCIIAVDPILEKESPDAFLVLGDTNSALCAIAAKKRRIPVFHMEAGNRSFDQRVPEELNRKIVDHISDINLPYSSIAREYLLKEGIPSDRIIKTGSPMYEVLHYYKRKIESSLILKQLSLESKQYFLISSHREENILPEVNFQHFSDFVNLLAETYQLPVIISTHPRTRKRVDESGKTFNKLIQFLKPLGFTDYNHLQLNAKCVLSDSGTISEESSILGFPAINIRESHERPEAMEEGVAMLTAFHPDRIWQAIETLSYETSLGQKHFNPVADYSVSNVSQKVLKILLSYTDYVNRVVWKK